MKSSKRQENEQGTLRFTPRAIRGICSATVRWLQHIVLAVEECLDVNIFLLGCLFGNEIMMKNMRIPKDV